MRPYSVAPLDGCAFGGTVEGYDLRAAIGDAGAVANLRADMERHKLLVFRGQTELSGEDHIALSEALGSLDHGLHRPHPRAPHPCLLRVSNIEEEGFVMVGVSGWHVDGVMLRAPFPVQTMHFLSAIPGGDTLFLSFKELMGAMDAELLERCRRLWFLSGVGKDLMAGDGQLSLLPLVYVHPATGEETMCFHLGKGYCLGWIEEKEGAAPEKKAPAGGLEGMFGGLFGGGEEQEGLEDVLRRLLGGSESASRRFEVLPPEPLQRQLAGAIESLSEEVRSQAICRQEWQTGDFALIDNMALAHLPAPGTQAAPDGPGKPGLRIFHRTTMTDPAAAPPRSVRGVPSVLLAGSGGQTGSGEESSAGGTRAGSVDDPRALRTILKGVVSATAGATAAPGARAVKKVDTLLDEQPAKAAPRKASSAKIKDIAQRMKEKRERLEERKRAALSEG